MTRRWLQVGVLAALGLGISSSLAFVLADGRWRDGRATVYIGIPGSDSAGNLYRDAFRDAVNAWNETPFRFVIQDSYRDPCSGYSRSSSGSGFPSGNGDSRNGVDFRSDVCGNSFASDTLAITLNLGRKGTLGFDNIVESDIIFNTAFGWAVYDGPRRSQSDFRRVALHELGHVLGLGHENTADAIMAPRITDRYTLTADDRAGAQALYGPPTTCPVRTLALNLLRRDSLEPGDCTIRELYRLGNDTSRVDVYRLELAQATTLRLRMASASLDSVLLITDAQLNPIDVFDGSGDGCNVDERVSLAAGSYLLLANTFVTPEKCGGNTGNYQLTVSDSPFPLLGNTGNARAGGELSAASFSGWARLDTASTARSNFAATDRITVEGRIDPDPAHIGQPGRLYVLAVLSNGLQFMQLPDGRFVPFPGLGRIEAVQQKTLQARDVLVLAQGLRGSTQGLAGLGFQVYLGYALNSAPQDIHFSAQPITFNIAAQ